MPEEPSIKRTHGGRRPGAGARPGNINALKTGRYSTRVRALRAVLQAMPQHRALLDGMTGEDKDKTELLAYGLMFYGEILLHIAAGGSLDDLTEAQLRSRVIDAIPLKQTQRMVDAIQGALGGDAFRV